MLKDAVKPDADVSGWKKLDLPHDWSIYNDFDKLTCPKTSGATQWW